ncbi:unnamed protein product, partial [Darwinula stevensoni]
MIASFISFATLNFNLGVDYKGGRTYVVKLKDNVNPTEISTILAPLLTQENGERVDVKTYGGDNQVKITTKYKIDDESPTVDGEILSKLYTGLKPYLSSGITQEQFNTASLDQGVRSSSKVGPTIADDIQLRGYYAIILSLLGIFLYILFRFRKWEFSTGAVLALFHDTVIVLGCFSLFYKYTPFSLEIDQAFIAAILTVIGYSINDTVIVFDRVRENLGLYLKDSLKKVFNDSINQTLGRTFNTSFTTLIVIVIIFIFGGETIRGFMFALLIGIGVGTYSSTYVASAITYDLLKGKLKNREPIMKHVLFLEGLAFSELALIILIALLIFGPKKIPEIARGLGEGVRKMRQATEEIKQEIMTQTQENTSIQEIKTEIEQAKKSIEELDGPIKRRENLIKTYGDKRVVKGVSLQVEQGEIIGLLGPNGAGKTTTFYMIVGLVRPTQGKVYLDSQDITHDAMYRRAQKGIGYLAQEASIFRKLSVEENILGVLQMTSLSKKEQRYKVDSLIEEFSLEHVRKNRGDLLSGGERRRTEIARCLSVDPKFILLDEPFAGVDPIAVEDIQKIVRSLVKKNIGILITDHNVQQTLAITDKTYIMFEGKILKSGKPEELANEPQVR